MDDEIHWLRVGPSTIPNAGEGVFATEDFPSGKILCEYAGYLKKGENVTDEELIYGMYFSDTEMLIGTNIGSKINDIIDFRMLTFHELMQLILEQPLPIHAGMQYNCHFHKFDDQTYIISNRNIKNGEELFVSYGKRYWIDKLIKNRWLFSKLII